MTLTMTTPTIAHPPPPHRRCLDRRLRHRRHPVDGRRRRPARHQLLPERRHRRHRPATRRRPRLPHAVHGPRRLRHGLARAVAPAAPRHDPRRHRHRSGHPRRCRHVGPRPPLVRDLPRASSPSPRPPSAVGFSPASRAKLTQPRRPIMSQKLTPASGFRRTSKPPPNTTPASSNRRAASTARFPDGRPLTAHVDILGTTFMILGDSPEFKPNESISFLHRLQGPGRGRLLLEPLRRRRRRGIDVRLVQGQVRHLAGRSSPRRHAAAPSAAPTPPAARAPSRR